MTLYELVEKLQKLITQEHGTKQVHVYDYGSIFSEPVVKIEVVYDDKETGKEIVLIRGK